MSDVGKKTSVMKIVIIALSVLLAVSIAALGIVIVKSNKRSEVSVSGENIITDKAETTETSKNIPMMIDAYPAAFAAKSVPGNRTVISFSTENTEETLPFSVANMFPGDSENKEFNVEVSHKDSMTLHFHADVREGYEKLAEVMMVKISELSSGETLYDGLMKDMPSSVDRVLSGAEKTDGLVYSITAYLNTSVNNDYMNKELVADFRWWIEEDDVKNLDTPPKTFDVFTVGIPAALIVASVVVFIVMKKRRRDTENV